MMGVQEERECYGFAAGQAGTPTLPMALIKDRDRGRREVAASVVPAKRQFSPATMPCRISPRVDCREILLELPCHV